MADVKKLGKLIKLFEDISPEAGKLIQLPSKDTEPLIKATKSAASKPSVVSMDELAFTKRLNQLNDRRRQSNSPALSPEQFRAYEETRKLPTEQMVSSGIIEPKKDILFDPEMSGQVDYMRKNLKPGTGSAKAMAPLGAASELYQQLQESPVGEAATQWNKIKKMVADKLAQQMDLSGGKDTGFQQTASDVLSTTVDPLNFIPGGAGAAIGAASMLGKEPEDKRKKKK